MSNEGKKKWLPLKKRLEEFKSEDCDWANGKVPAYTYKMGDDLDYVVKEAYLMYFGENALGQKAFRSVASLEKEVIDYGLGLFGHDETGAGIFTSGGTESIFLAVKAAREMARKTKPHITEPTIVLPRSGHASINKAAHLLGLKTIRTPIGVDFRADVVAMEAAVTHETIMIVGSAPGYTHGNFDDIKAIGEIAKAHDLWFHVDACFGGFVAPYAKKLGYTIPEFDFRIPQVTSLSADLHKYGYAPKGASMVLFRNAELKECARYMFRDWPRGLYHTYTFLGSRAAGPVAGAWAAINFLGEEGYVEAARIMMDIKKRLIAGIEAIPGLKVLYPNDLCILCYNCSDSSLEINAIADEMRKRNWFIGTAAAPQAIIFAINPIHEQSVDLYLSDLRDVAEDVSASGKVAEYDEATY